MMENVFFKKVNSRLTTAKMSSVFNDVSTVCIFTYSSQIIFPVFIKMVILLIYFAAAYSVSCGGGRFGINCSVCQSIAATENDWCNGDCHYDEKIGLCHEKSRLKCINTN